MKSSVNNLNSNQPKVLSKREDKKRVNLTWNHSLFFQVGLIVSLLAVFFIMESSFEMKQIKGTPTDASFLDEPFTIHEFEVDVPKVVEVQKNIVPKKLLAHVPKPVTAVINVVPNSSPTVETPTVPTSDPVIKNPTIVKTPEIPAITGTRNMNSVEFVPVFPGCESLGSNQEKIACMSSKIGAFIKNKFRADKFDYLNSGEIQKVFVQFKIDKSGNITDVVARAGDSELEDEGSRVISKLPKMKPGKQGNRNVDVMYMVPIIFKVD